MNTLKLYQGNSYPDTAQMMANYRPAAKMNLTQQYTGMTPEQNMNHYNNTPVFERSNFYGEV